MNGPELLEQHVGTLVTHMGAAFVGQRAVFRGHDLHHDLAGIDWLDLYVFGITGRRHNAQQIRLLHTIWAHTSYPDARIWNNRVAALAGATRSTGNLALSAALAVSEASIYGRGIDIRAIRFLQSTLVALADGGSIENCVRAELDRHRSLAGYGRPIAAADERIEPTMAAARKLGLHDGPHVRLAFAVEQYLLAGRWRWRMNYGILAAALCADLGFSDLEYYQFMFPAFLAGMPPCYSEALNKPEAASFVLRCDQIAYEGHGARVWPNRRET